MGHNNLLRNFNLILMSKKNFFIAVLQVIVIGGFIMIAAGSSNNVSPKEAYDAGYKIGSGMSTLINN